MGADRVLVYARFDDSTKDFPIDTKFAQIGIVKNPTSIGSTQVFTDNQFSSVKSLYLNSFDVNQTLSIGEKIQQSIKDGDTEVGKAFGYVVSYDIISEDDTSKVAILKYYQDRSLYFNPTTGDQTDYTDANSITERGSSSGTIYDFQSTSESVEAVIGSWNAKIKTDFSGATTNPTNNKIVELGVEFTNGIAASEINNESGDIIYLDNRALITRDARQKEDIKVILEF